MTYLAPDLSLLKPGREVHVNTGAAIPRGFRGHLPKPISGPTSPDARLRVVVVGVLPRPAVMHARGCATCVQSESRIQNAALCTPSTSQVCAIIPAPGSSRHASLPPTTDEAYMAGNTHRV